MIKKLFLILVVFGILTSCKTPSTKDPEPIKKPTPTPPIEREPQSHLFGRVLEKASTSLPVPPGVKSLEGYTLSPDGSKLALWGEKEIHLFDLKTKKYQKTFPQGAKILDAALSSQKMVLALEKKPLLLIEGGGPKEKKVPLAFSSTRVALSPDGETLAFRSSQGKIGLYSLSQKKALSPLEGPLEISRLYFSSRGKWLVAQGKSQVRFWTANSWRVKGKLDCYNHTFSSDENEVLLYRTDRVFLWDIYGEENLKNQPLGNLKALGYSPQGSLLGGLSREGEILFWNSQTFEKIFSIKTEGPVMAFLFSPFRYEIYTLEKGGRVQSWSLVEGDLSNSYLEAIKQKEGEFQFQRGEKALAQKDLEGAKKFWKKALEFDKEHQKSLLRLGELQKEEFEKVYEKTQPLITSHLQKGEIQKALDEYNQMLQFKTYSYSPLVEILEELGLFKKALLEYQQGEELSKQKKPAQAYPHYLMALKYDPSLDMARAKEQTLWKPYYESLPKEKKQTFLTVRKKKLTPPPATSAKKKLLAKLKKKTTTLLAKAVKKTTTPIPRVIKKNPPKKGLPGELTPEEVFAKAEKFRSEGTSQKSLPLYKKLILHPQWGRKSTLALAEIFFLEKNYDQALHYFQKSREGGKLTSGEQEKMAQCYIELKNKGEALKIYRSLAKSQQTAALFQKVLALALERKELPLAYQTCTRLMELDRENHRWREERCKLGEELSQEKPSYLTALAEDFEALAEKKPSFFLKLGEVYQKIGKKEEAKEAYLKGFHRDQSQGLYKNKLEGLGYIYSRQEWVDEKSYYTRQGLVQAGQEWVTPLKKKLLDRMSGASQPPRKLSPERAKEALAKKELQKGMNRREVVAVMGFWKEVQVAYRGEDTYELLYFPHKRRCVYLWNDLVMGWE